MPSHNLTGVIIDPIGDYSVGDEFRFITTRTTGRSIRGSRSLFTVPQNGAYNIDLEYGDIFIEYRAVENAAWYIIGTVTIDENTTATTLPELIRQAGG